MKFCLQKNLRSNRLLLHL